jgi:aspartate aminotransferase
MSEEDKPYVFDIVKHVQRELLDEESAHRECLPIDGYSLYNEFSKRLVFGKEAKNLGNIVTFQTMGCTGALKMGAELVKKYIGSTIHISDPSWPVHHMLFSYEGLVVKEYPYFNRKEKCLSFDTMVNHFDSLPPHDVIVMQPIAHNPTGTDPTPEQWRRLAEVIKTRRLIPFFDFSYQGFASGNLETDAYVIRLFNDHGIQMLVAQTYSKNLGLYNERVGALHIVCSGHGTADVVLSNIRLIARTSYSTPPMYGAIIVYKILSKPEYMKRWEDELAGIVSKIRDVRFTLKKYLTNLQTPGSWEFVTSQVGMFIYPCFTGNEFFLFLERVTRELIDRFHIYLLKDGRLSLSGINFKNLEYVANSINMVMNSSR